MWYLAEPPVYDIHFAQNERALPDGIYTTAADPAQELCTNTSSLLDRSPYNAMSTALHSWLSQAQENTRYDSVAAKYGRESCRCLYELC